jgi:NAD-specific glutamate dehydrogenase
MTDEVGLNVLVHNYDQTLALTLHAGRRVPAIDSYAALHGRR